MSSRGRRPDDQEYDLLEMTQTRKAIAQHTLKSVRQKPHFSMTTEVDATALKRVRTAAKEELGDEAPTYNDYVLKVAGMVLPDHRRFNAWVAKEGLKLLKRVNVAFAVATEQGVLLPTVMDVDKTPVVEIAERTRELIELSRNGKLRASLQMGAGFTVSNMGPTVIDQFSAVISPPQTGILTLGAIKPRPVVRDGEVVACDTMISTLVVDHSAADGADGTRFLEDYKKRVEDEEFLKAL